MVWVKLLHCAWLAQVEGGSQEGFVTRERNIERETDTIERMKEEEHKHKYKKKCSTEGERKGWLGEREKIDIRKYIEKERQRKWYWKRMSENGWIECAGYGIPGYEAAFK